MPAVGAALAPGDGFLLCSLKSQNSTSPRDAWKGNAAAAGLLWQLAATRGAAAGSQTLWGSPANLGLFFPPHNMNNFVSAVGRGAGISDRKFSEAGTAYLSLPRLQSRSPCL